jgi:GrpB-like predicted nucleotidyltransferase (UPF0157 family)
MVETDDELEFRGGVLLGRVRDDPIEVVSYDPRWPGKYKRMRQRLVQALGPLAVQVEHVGSTAVPGLAAKPIIDIQVSVPDVEDEDAYRAAIESCGFALRYREAGHRYFRPPPGRPREYQVHVCTVGSRWEREHLLFRDFLRTHAEEAARYEAIKYDVAGHHRDDRIAYMDAKGPMITQLLSHAEDWAASTGWQRSFGTSRSRPPRRPPPRVHSRARP